MAALNADMSEALKTSINPPSTIFNSTLDLSEEGVSVSGRRLSFTILIISSDKVISMFAET